MNIKIGNGLDSFGDSFTAGFNATNNNGYASQLSQVVKGTFRNYGVGSSLSELATINAYKNLSNNRTQIVTWMAGLNDIRTGGINVLNKIEGNLRAFIASCFLENICPASLMQRVGTWTNLPNVYGGKSYYVGGSPLYTSGNINASLTWNFEGDNVVIGAYRTNGTTGFYQDLLISIDNGPNIDFALLGKTDEQISFDCKLIENLGSGQHTIKIMPKNANQFTTVDFVATLNKDKPPVFISEIPFLLNWSQFGSIANKQICDAANVVINNVVSEFLCYPVELVKVNDFYDFTVNASPDGLHPNTSGHTQIMNAFLNKMTFEQVVNIPEWVNTVEVNGQKFHRPLTVIFKD